MVFSSVSFIFIFLPITLLGYFVLPQKAKNYWLLLVSLIFFAWSQPNYLWIILLNIIINYASAILISKQNKGKKVSLLLAIAANLAILFYFKYFNFTLSTVLAIMKSRATFEQVVLPIGISFFTFQGMSYVIDVYREDVKVQKNPFKVALYITLFPQLIAGPIVRYVDIEKDMEDRSVRMDDISVGIERFIIGLGKKTIIANNMAYVVDSVWSFGSGNHMWTVAWFASIAYTIQIYFDFSGYSDMAIGLGRIFGFHFNENFNLPYISQDITEFWRRWHISLSTWFRDYVYIPLGGNRKRVYLNLAIVFLLTGIWHGAAWTFILWGIWNGFFILIERYIKSKRGKDSSSKPYIVVLKKIYTLLVVNFGWVLFRASDITTFKEYIKSMFGLADYNLVGFKIGWYVGKWELFIMILGIFFASSLPGKIKKAVTGKLNTSVAMTVKYLALLIVFFLSMLSVVSGTYNPFIYFQF